MPITVTIKETDDREGSNISFEGTGSDNVSSCLWVLLQAYIGVAQRFIAEHPLDCQGCDALVMHTLINKYARETIDNPPKVE